MARCFLHLSYDGVEAGTGDHYRWEESCLSMADNGCEQPPAVFIVVTQRGACDVRTNRDLLFMAASPVNQGFLFLLE